MMNECKSMLEALVNGQTLVLILSICFTTAVARPGFHDTPLYTQDSTHVQLPRFSCLGVTC